MFLSLISIHPSIKNTPFKRAFGYIVLHVRPRAALRRSGRCKGCTESRPQRRSDRAAGQPGTPPGAAGSHTAPRGPGSGIAAAEDAGAARGPWAAQGGCGLGRGGPREPPGGDTTAPSASAAAPAALPRAASLPLTQQREGGRFVPPRTPFLPGPSPPPPPSPFPLSGARGARAGGDSEAAIAVQPGRSPEDPPDLRFLTGQRGHHEQRG